MGKTKKKNIKKKVSVNENITVEEKREVKKKVGLKKLMLRALVWLGLIIIVLFFVAGVLIGR